MVLWQDTVYDVTKFKKEHPGGEQLVIDYFGKRIDEPFEEENHSAHARTIFKKLPVVGYFNEVMNEKLTDDFDKEMKNSFCCSRKYIFKKLVTKEDPIYLHKILGLFAICSFIYRFYYVFPLTGNLGFEGTWFDHFTIFMHIALSVSSLIFHVLKQRILKRPLVIWEEYRLHAISFTMRGVSAYLFALFWPYEWHTDFQHLC